MLNSNLLLLPEISLILGRSSNKLEASSTSTKLSKRARLSYKRTSGIWRRMEQLLWDLLCFLVLPLLEHDLAARSFSALMDLQILASVLWRARKQSTPHSIRNWPNR